MENEEVYTINPTLVELIEAHGFQAKIVDEKVLPNFKENITLETWAMVRQNNNSTFASRLDIGVTLADGTELFECFGDIGLSVDDVIHKNIQNFCEGSWHVFLDAFNDTTEHTTQKVWQINQHRYQAFIGNITFKSMMGQLFETTLQSPTDLLENIKQAVYQQKLDQDYYFIRFFYCQVDSQPIATEFMINNENLPDIENQLASLSWKVSEDYYSSRLFMILKRLD